MKKVKWILKVLGIIFLIFITLTVYKTVTISSKQPDPIPSSVQFDEEKAVVRFSNAITYETVSYPDNNKLDLNAFTGFIEFLEKSYPLVHGHLELELVNDYALIYTWRGRDESKKPVGLTSHYDVVPVLEGTVDNWQEPPFSGNVVDGVVWGRGTLDDKIGVIGILEAVEYLITNDYHPERDMYFMFGHDEEIGGEDGAQAIVDLIESRGIRFDFVLDEGGAIVEKMVPGVTQPVGVIGVSEKGSAVVELTIEGSGGHSSQPQNKTNIGRISQAIAKLEETQFKGELRGPGKELFEFVAPEMDLGMKYVFANKELFKPIIEGILLDQPASAALIRTTIAPTIFHAGEQYNVLPEKATAYINLRLMPGDSLENVKEYIVKTIDDPDISVTITGSEASNVSSSDSWQFRAIQQAARNVYHDAIIAPYLMFAGSDAKHYERISDETYRFLPVQITSKDLERMHGTDEHISVENYLNAIRFYVEIIQISNQKK